MMYGLNYVSDEAGNIKAVLIDLVQMKEAGITAAQAIGALNDLQMLIDQAVVPAKKTGNWDQARERLKNLKMEE